MLIGVIADDFTGASDVANTLAKGLPPEGGLTTAQFIGVPESDADPSIDAGVIALKTRSIDKRSAIEQSLKALEWLKSQGCIQFVFKYCSTFDSTPEGNIGPVAEALANALGVTGVVVCPAFPGAGRTVYQGHLFVFDQLLNESGMQNHPLTPMTDSDLRRWLSFQTSGTVGHVALPDVRVGGVQLENALNDVAEAGALFCVVDTVVDADLVQLGQAIKDHPLITGGSGIALAVPGNMHSKGLASKTDSKSLNINGKGAILAGSCSGATRAQIEHHAKQYESFFIDVNQVMQGNVNSKTLVEFITANSESLPLVYSSSSPDKVHALQKEFGLHAVSESLDELFANTASELVSLGYTRLVIAGGETSSAVALKLSEQQGEAALRIGQEIDPGVPVLSMGSCRTIALALKSGNFGELNFFEKAFAVMAGE